PTPPPPAPVVQPQPAPAPPPPVTVIQPQPVAPAPAPPPRDEHPGRGKKVTGVVLASVGLVALGTGVAFGLQASSEADKVSKLSANGGMWDSSYSDAESAGKRDQTISRVGIAVGAAGIVGGVVLYVMGINESAAAPVAVGLRPGGGDLVLSWRY